MKEKNSWSLLSLGQEVLDALTMKLQLPTLAGVDGTISPAYVAECSGCYGSCEGTCYGNCAEGCAGNCCFSCVGFNQ